MRTYINMAEIHKHNIEQNKPNTKKSIYYTILLLHEGKTGQSGEYSLEDG